MVPAISFIFPGEENSVLTIKTAYSRAVELSISHLVLASTTGRTGLLAIDLAAERKEKIQLVVVGEHSGYHEPGKQQMPLDVQKRLSEAGVKLFFGTHALSSISRSFRRRWGGLDSLEIMAEVLRRFSRGVKVAIETAVMAADAGLIPVDRDVMAVGGTSRGADSAVVLRPASSNCFFDLKIREILAMPRLRQIEVVEKIIALDRQGRDALFIAQQLGCLEATVSSYLQEFKQVKDLRHKGYPPEKIGSIIDRGDNTIEMYFKLLDRDNG